MAQDLFKHWYIKLAQFIFFRALAQVEGIVRQRVLWPQFLSNLCYEVLSISFFLPQQVSRIKIDFCGILLPSSGGCKARKETLHLALGQPFFSIKEPIALLVSCFPHIVGHLLRVSFTPSLLSKVKSGRKVVFNLLGEPRISRTWPG